MSRSTDKLLITGTTGYIGFQTLTYALRQGYSVRAVVRAQKNISDLQSKDALISSASANGQLEFSIVPDFLEKDVLVPVLKDITAVVHLASPLAYGIKGEDLEAEVIRPAIDMVLVVLEAAMKVPTIKRVVITSSSVTLVPFEWNMKPDTQRLYTSADINANPKGPYSSAMEAYWASKGLSRQATRDFITDRSPHFDFINLLPSVVIGADTRLSSVRGSTISELLQGTRAAVMAPALTAEYNSPFPYVGVPVHVADVARAHIDAVDSSRIPGNTEYILSSDTPEGVVWDPEVTRIAKEYFSDAVEDKRLKLEGSLGHVGFRLDGMATEAAFGWKLTSFEETMKGLIGQYLELEKGS